MNKLKAYLDEASIAYYSGTPIISDEVFDALADMTGYAKVGAKQHENVSKHYHQMFSLQKYYEGEGNKPLQGYSITATPKLDGAAISALYVMGKLVQVLTRGDGIEGQDITNKFLARTDLLPHTIDYMNPTQVTGEVVVPKYVTNSRNLAAGSLNLKDISEFKTRPLSFFAYGVFPTLTTSFSQDMRVLSSWGFGTVYDPEIHNIYDCDGIVQRVNDNALFEELGYTAKAPRGAYAIKERKEAVETKILSVEWGVGKSGKVTPVAILEPVMIGDKVVTRATLNNPGFIESLGLCIGDTVGVILGGEIIPCITYKVEA
jgi:DNA ligase (NAD+)